MVKNETGKIDKEIWITVRNIVFIGGLIAGIIFGVFVPIWQMKSEIAVVNERMNKIENNDLQHIQTGIKDINDKLDKYIEQTEKRLDILEQKIND